MVPVDKLLKYKRFIGSTVAIHPFVSRSAMDGRNFRSAVPHTDRACATFAGTRRTHPKSLLDERNGHACVELPPSCHVNGVSLLDQRAVVMVIKNDPS